MYTVSFTQAEQALRTAGAAVTLAEAHGCLCGALCALPQFSTQSWLQELLPDPAETTIPPVSTPPDISLAQLYTETQLALQGDAMEFSPLLPDDEAPIVERVAALAQWSQGFLYGFGIGVPGAQHLPGEVPEILKDLSEIARASEAGTSDNDAEEESYAELVEYLRAAAQLIHDELAGQRAEQGRRQTRAH